MHFKFIFPGNIISTHYLTLPYYTISTNQGVELYISLKKKKHEAGTCIPHCLAAYAT